MIVVLILMAAVLPACADAGGQEEGTAMGEGRPATAAWDRVLRAHGRDGGLDYAGLKADRGDLDAYLASLETVDPEGLSEPERLALWTNAYNAVVAAFVLDRYPGIESVEDVDGFFDRQTRRVAGEEMTLDQIEKRARAIDARVHFAVVCASTSCPDLRGEAFTGAAVDSQLEEQTRAFLADRDKGLRYDAAKNELWLSSIFKWYAGDFTGGSTLVAFFARGGVVEWILPHLADRELAAELERRDPSVHYMDYDWSLNDR
jgi:hypothetical protein